MTVQLACDDGHLDFTVQDDGSDFSDARAGDGLTHMRDRVAAVGGRVVVVSEPGRGTVVSGSAPSPARPAGGGERGPAPVASGGVALVETAATAAVAFAATNVDDVVLLSILFARRDERFRTEHIVLGQYLGFVALIGASLAAAAGLLALPEWAIGVLGLIPLGLGLKGLWQVLRAGAGAEPAEPAGSAGSGDDGGAEAARVGQVDRAVRSTRGVATLTVVNGADNVAVYAPLFATLGTGDFLVTSAVFLVLAGALCVAGLLVGSRPAVVRLVGWAGDYAVPVVLIALGVWIVAASDLPRTLLG